MASTKPLRRGKDSRFACLQCTYGFPNPFLFDYNCFAISISYLFLVSVFIMFLLTRLGVVHECVWVTCLSFRACLAANLAQATWVMALLHWA